MLGVSYYYFVVTMDEPGFDSQLPKFPAVLSWVSGLTILSFNLLICKMIIISSSTDFDDSKR